jgi:hypothetical protein
VEVEGTEMEGRGKVGINLLDKLVGMEAEDKADEGSSLQID